MRGAFFSYAYCMVKIEPETIATRVETPTVIVTPEGNIHVEGGELVEEVVPGEEVESVRQIYGKKPNNAGALWDAGRPLRIKIKGKNQTISRSFMREPGENMDYALPPKVLQRRKQLIRDRMKQERL